MKGNPMKRNFGISPAKKTTDKKTTELGSDQESNIEEGRQYVDSSTGTVYSAGMMNLLKHKPPKDSPEYAGWKKAYDKAKARQIAANE